MADSEPVLRSLGITLRSPFNWDNEPRIHPTKKSKRTHPDPGKGNGDAPASSGSKTPPKSSLPVSSAELLALTAPSGLDSIKKFALEENHDDGDKNAKAKKVLRSLLRDANVALPSEDGNDDDDDNAAAKRETFKQIAKQRKRHEKLLLLHGSADGELRDVPIRGLSDRAVAQLTVESKASLFGSILRIFDIDRAAAGRADGGDGGEDEDRNQTRRQDDRSDENIVMKRPILTAPEIVRTVHLAARPGDIPPGMDSKEYTLAALHFLSTPIPTLSERDFRSPPPREGSREGWDFLRKHLPVMPLLRPIDPKEAIEKRSYGRVRPLISPGSDARKEVPDSVDADPEFRKRVLNLERIFASSVPYSAASYLRARAKRGGETNTAATTASDDDDDDDDENDVRFAFQKYVPRRKLCPHIDGGVKEELTVMISGHFQQQYQPGLASSKASNASLATTTTTTAAASNKVSSPTKAKSTAGGGKASAGKPQGKKPTPHLRIKLGLGSKAKAERGEGSGSGKIGGVGDGGGVGVKSPSREMENQWPESGGYSEMKDGSKKKRVMSDREEFGF
mmetsp:Transcript_5931/g.13105  ORF Transcript_5931/g.13105 Transcript_5931/m.13105 type:complete len:565 (+) Transcript_5931:89-1783(+)